MPKPPVVPKDGAGALDPKPPSVWNKHENKQRGEPRVDRIKMIGKLLQNYNNLPNPPGAGAEPNPPGAGVPNPPGAVFC